MFAGDYEKLAKANTNFRQVLQTGQHLQVVAMSIPVGGDIGEETHPQDQLFFIGDGYAEIVVNGETRRVEEDGIAFVPAGAVHNVKNAGDEDLKLITVYGPPAHPDGEVQATK